MTPLEALCAKLHILIASRETGEVPEGWSPGTRAYKCTLYYQYRQLTVPFYMGAACQRGPTAADVLACLCSDARFGEYSFGDFCSDMGLDEDSRKAEATWKSCVAIGPRLRRFLGSSFDVVSREEH